MERAIALLDRGELTVEPLLTHSYSLDEINEAFAIASEMPQGFVKAIVCPQGT